MISIALASYNGEKYICQQLDSILNQTILDFELIICDDCSSDSTWEIISEYASKDKRIQCYLNEQNFGFKKNFEKAISLCHGEFIALSDQDDIWTPNHLEILKDLIADKIMACGNAELIDASGNLMNIKLNEIERFDICHTDDLKKAYPILYWRNTYQGASMLIRKEFFEKALPINDDVNYHDAWFAALACFTGGINYTKTSIVYYRQHDKNASVHEAFSFWQSLFKLKSQVNNCTDRYCFCSEILKRTSDLSKLEKEMLQTALKYHSRKQNRLYRFANALIRFYHYSDIYATKSKKLLIPRLIKYFLT